MSTDVALADLLFGHRNHHQERQQRERMVILEKVAEEYRQARELLRNAGFGVTGTPLLETVKEALEELENRREYFRRSNDE